MAEQAAQRDYGFSMKLLKAWLDMFRENLL